MKLALQAFLLLIFCQELLAQRFDINLVLDGRQRECIVFKPNHAPPVGGYPVVFMLHGTAQDGEQFSNISGWKELGEQENFITVFPTSLKWCFVDDGIEEYQTRWVNGNVIENPCSGPPQNYIDDVKFLKLLVSIISDSVPVNRSKVFASGFSNGSAMIHKLAMDAGDVFAAVAGTSGPLSSLDSTNTPVRRIPIWFMLGNKDPKFIKPPFVELPFGGDSILAYLREPISRALTCQGLTESFIENETPAVHTYIFNESQSMMNSSPYLFSLIKDMIHIYPNGTNFPLSAPKLFWEFFKQATVVATEDELQKQGWLSAFPNPSSDQIQFVIHDLNALSPYRLYVTNVYGQIVFEENHKMDPAFILEKDKIGSGLFILHIHKGSHAISKKILFN